MPNKDSAEVREQLAAIEHERWASWQKWLHEQCPKVEHDGKLSYLMLSAANYRRWEQQINTLYSELSEKEKQSDREQVDRYWPHIQAYTAAQVAAASTSARVEEHNLVYTKSGELDDGDFAEWSLERLKELGVDDALA